MGKGFTIWFTGLSGSGKSTLSRHLQEECSRADARSKSWTATWCAKTSAKDWVFPRKTADINIRRIGFVCHLLTRNDVVAIAAAISPYRAIRDENRALIGRFVEVYCQCDLDTLTARDPKGLYEKARRGELANFTGVSDPYEPPYDPEVTVNTALESVATSTRKILDALEAPRPPAQRFARLYRRGGRRHHRPPPRTGVHLIDPASPLHF